MAISKIETKSNKIRSCAINIEDLKILYSLLEAKVREAKDYELAESQLIKQSANDKKEELKQFIENLYKLSIHVFGERGEYLVGDEASIFDDRSFPNRVSQIIFDSAYYYKSATNLEPLNKLIVQFDFKKQMLFDFTNPLTAPALNLSSITISGISNTWVGGVYEEANKFLKEKEKKRNWLHKKHIYDVFLYFYFYPTAFWTIYRVSGLLKPKISTFILIGICFYVFMILLLLMRIIFNYIRWIFPLIEFVPKYKSKMARHRAALFIILAGIISAFIWDLLKTLGR
jgi:hypothetical protein